MPIPVSLIEALRLGTPLAVEMPAAIQNVWQE